MTPSRSGTVPRSIAVSLCFMAVPTLLLGACTKKGADSTSRDPQKAETNLKRLSRDEFNRLAPEAGHALFWRADANSNGAVDAAEVSTFWGLNSTQMSKWVRDGAFTPDFERAYEGMVVARGNPLQAASANNAAGSKATANTANAVADVAKAGTEAARQDALRREIRQGRFTLIDSDFSAATSADKQVVAHVLKAAALIEQLHNKQIGSFGLEAGIPGDDTASELAFFLNHGPWCRAPDTESDADCGALAKPVPERSGLYPADIQGNKGFCDELAARDDAAELFHQFSVVRRDKKGELVAVPYTVAYGAEMLLVATELKAAAAALGDPKQAGFSEGPFQEYLLAAAKAFKDNEWFAADEAWARMNAQNSKWYLRIGPDEVYFEPCSRKAGFHVSFARINPGSVAWQQKLEPVKADMERALAKKAGAPYKAREVAFHLPDFIDIVVNAGDSRNARGATIGQSLPNWGPVASEARGRTVVMSNISSDPDSRATLRAQAESMLCTASMKDYVDDPAPGIMTTVLHEAAHNLGPAHEYRVNGKTGGEVFGGPMASIMEELKAQSSALYFTGWLADRGIIDEGMARRGHTADLVWALGHISRGFRDADGLPKPYSQLAGIQVGYFLDAGALAWSADGKAANGKDQGCVQIDTRKLRASIDTLMGVVAGIKAKGDAAAAKALVAKFIDGDGVWATVAATARERWRRHPRASFLYGVRM